MAANLAVIMHKPKINRPSLNMVLICYLNIADCNL